MTAPARICRDCGKTFVVSERARQGVERHGWFDLPVRCGQCLSRQRRATLQADHDKWVMRPLAKCQPRVDRFNEADRWTST